ADPDRITRLIADLGSDQFNRREKASAELEYLGKFAQAQLEKALNEKPSDETRRRVSVLLNKLTGSPATPPAAAQAAANDARRKRMQELRMMELVRAGAAGGGPGNVVLGGLNVKNAPAAPAAPSPLWVRAARAAAVLEHIGTPEARQVLRSVAEGEADAL